VEKSFFFFFWWYWDLNSGPHANSHATTCASPQFPMEGLWSLLLSSVLLQKPT
jgi:hypothetical protein